jgi:DNA/RNA endonuclease YhcR with UshA esterase domain
MLRTKLAIATMMMGMLATARPVLAHHSFSAEYDFAKPITLQGTVVKWELINPHGWITVDVKDANGQVVRWAVETGNPNALLRAGWRKDSLKPGDEVTIEGYLAKDGTPTVNGVQVTLADGRKVLAASSVTNGR